ncbi:MAG: hypothetical protein GXO22_08045 [Aquificae bacterium]|nr:hypothetical protein [Aquificota bacterium]
MRKFTVFLYITCLLLGLSYAQWKPDTKSSGKGIIIYKYEGDADEVVQLLKMNLEAQQITIVDTTNPIAPLEANVKIFSDYDKLNITFVQNFLVTSISTLYKIFTGDPNALVISPMVITVYQVEDDDYTYIVRAKVSMLLDGTKYPKVKKAVEELEKRIDTAIKSML